MDVTKIKAGENPPYDINVIIEVPLGGEPIKYEMDKDSGAMFVDRFLYTAMRYPCNYGFIPHTLSDDGRKSYKIVSRISSITIRTLKRINGSKFWVGKAQIKRLN